MKIIYTFLFIPFLFFIFTNVNAQFYLEFSGGYNFGVNGDDIIKHGFFNEGDYIGKYSYGNGSNIELSAGYKIISNIEVGVSLNYLEGSMGGKYVFENWGEIYARAGQLTPFISLNYQVGKFTPFVKVGPLLAYGKTYSIRDDGDDNHKIKNIGLGYSASVGSLYEMTDKLQVFTSLKLISLSLSHASDYNDRDIYDAFSSAGIQIGLRYNF